MIVKKLVILLVLTFCTASAHADVLVYVRAKNPFEKQPETYAILATAKKTEVLHLNGAGDIIQVMEDCPVVENMTQRDYYIFRVLGVKLEDVKMWMDSLGSGDYLLNERAYYIDKNLLSKENLEVLEKTYFLEMKYEDFSKIIVAKKTATDNFDVKMDKLSKLYYQGKHLLSKAWSYIESFAFASTPRVRYVNTNADAGGNGTTSALTGANCAYKSMSIAENAEDDTGNLDALNQTLYLYCAGTTADTAVCFWSGWTTSADDFIYVEGNNRQSYYNSDAYHMEVGGGGFDTACITVYEEYVWINYIQATISQETTSNNGRCICLMYNDDNDGIIDSLTLISNCILRSGTIVSGAKFWGITSLTIDSSYAIAYNNIIYDPSNESSYGIYFSSQSGNPDTLYAYNNTIIGCSTGGLGGSDSYTTITAKNNIVVGSGNTDSYTGTFVNSDYNATDGTDVTPGGAHDSISQTFGFVSETVDSENYALKQTDTGAKDQGTNLSNDSVMAFNRDIRNFPRVGTWDKGAVEYSYGYFLGGGTGSATGE